MTHNDIKATSLIRILQWNILPSQSHGIAFFNFTCNFLWTSNHYTPKHPNYVNSCNRDVFPYPMPPLLNLSPTNLNLLILKQFCVWIMLRDSSFYNTSHQSGHIAPQCTVSVDSNKAKDNNTTVHFPKETVIKVKQKSTHR